MTKQTMLDGPVTETMPQSEVDEQASLSDDTAISYEELVAKNEKLQAELRRRDDEAARLVEQGGDGPVSRVPRVDTKGPQYRFVVRGAGKSAAHLPTKEIKCGDESEAKRIYCLETEDTAEGKHGRAVSPTEYRFDIVNRDEHVRQQSIRSAYRFNELRRKYNGGITLTKQETQELAKLEPIFGAEARRVAAATGKAWNESPQPVGAV